MKSFYLLFIVFVLIPTITNAAKDNLPYFNLSPNIKISQQEQDKLSLSYLHKFFSKNKLITPKRLDTLPYVHTFNTQQERQLFSYNDVVFINNISCSEQQKRFGIYRKKSNYLSNDKNKKVTELAYLGYGKIISCNNKEIATLAITKANKEINANDYLIPILEEDQKQYFNHINSSPNPNQEGYVISIIDANGNNLNVGGDGHNVIIDIGKNNNVHPGDILNIYNSVAQAKSDLPATLKTLDKDFSTNFFTNFSKDFKKHFSPKPPPTPLKKIGKVIVYSVANDFSYGIVTNLEQEIEIGNTISIQEKDNITLVKPIN